MAKIIPSSLTARLFLVSTLVILLFLPLAGLVLEQVYSKSLDARLHEQLKVQTYGLMGLADELEPGTLWLPEVLPDERFNQIDSGKYAQVLDSQGHPIWQSQSAINIKLPNPVPDVPGELNIEDINPPGQFLFEKLQLSDESVLEVTRVTVIWEGPDETENIYTFSVAEDLKPYLLEKATFRETLLIWLGGLAGFLLTIQVIALIWALRPLNHLAREIRLIEDGDIHSLETSYPTELNRVAVNLNKLIQHEQHQRKRYRNTLQDLAHSLKTPLSVIQSSIDSIKDQTLKNNLTEHSDRMKDIIGYQLQRAVNAGANPMKLKVSIKSCLDKIIKALHKVYRDNNISFEVDIKDSSIFYGDENDLLEVLGNLCDNACKYGKSKVKITVNDFSDESSETLKTGVEIRISDNGKGVPEYLENVIFQRGKRLDEQVEGQGIGLSVVYDIVSSYKGKIKLYSSKNSGATFQIQLPGRA